MRKLWTPKSYRNWARVHDVSQKEPSDIKIPDQIQLVHDITHYGYSERSKVSYGQFGLTSPATGSFSGSSVAWNSNAHNWLYHMGFTVSSGADADADAYIAFMVEVPNTSGGSSTLIPLSPQFICPKITSEETHIGFTLPTPFMMPPKWYPAFFWNGTLAASTGTLYAVHIESKE